MCHLMRPREREKKRGHGSGTHGVLQGMEERSCSVSPKGIAAGVGRYMRESASGVTIQCRTEAGARLSRTFYSVTTPQRCQQKRHA